MASSGSVPNFLCHKDGNDRTSYLIYKELRGITTEAKTKQKQKGKSKKGTPSLLSVFPAEGRDFSARCWLTASSPGDPWFF